MTLSNDGRYRAASVAYLAYGVVYWLGGAWLAWQGVGVRAGGSTLWRGVFWILAGLMLVALIPYLLRRRRRFFERWVLSRRDFARLLSAFMAVRAYAVAKVALTSEAAVPAPWGGEISFRAGAVFFFLVTIVAAAVVTWAAWTEDPDRSVAVSPHRG